VNNGADNIFVAFLVVKSEIRKLKARDYFFANAHFDDLGAAMCNDVSALRMEEV
jgi:hypothetical protein